MLENIMKTKFVVMPLITIFLMGCAAPGWRAGGSPIASVHHLQPYGARSDSPVIIRAVYPNTPAVGVVNTGDTVISVGSTQTPNTPIFFDSLMSPNIKSISIRKVDTGLIETIPASKLVDQNNKKLFFSMLGAGQTLIYTLDNPVEGQEEAGYFPINGSGGLVAADLWMTTPRILEFYFDMATNPGCENCEIKNIAAMDWSRRAWLAPVSPIQVAWQLYPDRNAPHRMMNVPPPIPISSTSTAYTNGAFNAQTYGNSISGNYTANTTGTTTQYYDYTMTNMALAYNLGTLIQENKIRADTQSRKEFVARREGNLRIGPLNPGERVTGYVFFSVPEQFTGPYIIFINDGKAVAPIRFDLPSS